MKDRDAAKSLRDILAKSPSKTSTQSLLQLSKSNTPVVFEPVTALAYKPPPKTPVLEYPLVDVPGSSPSSTPVATPSSSIFGSGLFGYAKSSSGMTPIRSASDGHSEGFFGSFLRRNDNGEGIAENQRRSIGTRKHSQSSVARSVALLSSSSLHSMMGSSTNILPGLTSIFHSGEPSRIAGGGALIRAASRNSLSAKDDDYEHRRYTASKTSKTTSTAPKTPSPRPLANRVRTVSWADQIPSRAATSPSPSSDLDLPEAQTTHGSENAPLFEQEYSDSSPSSSTLSLNSPFSSNLYLPARPCTYASQPPRPLSLQGQTPLGARRR
jgi:hypothetical protein